MLRLCVLANDFVCYMELQYIQYIIDVNGWHCIFYYGLFGLKILLIYSDNHSNL